MDTPLAAPLSPGRPLLPLRLLGDERLARLIGSGRDDAFAALYERHHQALYRYCRSLVGSESDAQDALQTAMTGALVALRSGRRDAPLRPWLFRIAYNESMTLLRRRRSVAALPADLPSPEGSPHHTAEERVRLAELVADLRELPERQRGALVMRELSGLSHTEISEAFGITVGAAKQTVLEARRSLLEFAEGRAMACEEVQSLISGGDGRALRGRRIRAHMRDCAACSALAAAIPQRKADLHALSPALPATAATGLLVRITGAGSGHGSGGTAGLTAGATTSKVLTAGISGKLLATGAVVLATAAAGAGGALHALNASSPTRAGAVAGETRATAGSSPQSAGNAPVGLSSARIGGAQSGHGAGISAAHRGASHGSANHASTVTTGRGGAAAQGGHRGQGRGTGGSGSPGSSTGPRGRPAGSTPGRSAAAHAAHKTKRTGSVKRTNRPGAKVRRATRRRHLVHVKTHKPTRHTGTGLHKSKGVVKSSGPTVGAGSPPHGSKHRLED